MPGIATNPDLPLSWRRPGTYLYFNLNNPGGAPGKRLLLLGERTSSGQRPTGALYRANSEQDVINGAGSASVLRMLFNTAITQVGGGVADIWIGQVDEYSSGAAATFTFKVIATPTGTGFVNWGLCGRTASTGFSSSDTATTIAANLVASAQLAFAGLPIASIAANSGTITLTLATKAAWGEDMPSVFYVSPGLGVSMAVQLALATNATGAGTMTLVSGRYSYTANVANADTPTTIAHAMALAITGDGPFIATDSAGTLTLTIQNGWPIRHVVGTIVTSTGTTIAVNGGSPIAAGTGASNGVIGTGSPTTTLTTLLNSIDAQPASFREWCGPWSDATTLGSIDSVMEDEGGGMKCKNQRLTTASNAALATAGAIPGATTPALTASVRCGLLWPAYECGNAAFELSARVAAALAASDKPRQNWNGLKLKSSPTCPLVGPPASGRSTASDINSAINVYYMAPVVWDDSLGAPKIEHSRTTSNSADRALHKWSLIRQLDAQREYIIQKFGQRFTLPDGTGVSLMPAGVPFSEGIVTLSDFEDATFEATVEMEKLGFYWGAEQNKAGIDAEQSAGDPNRINLQYTATALVDVDIVSVVANRAGASQ